MKKCTRIGLLRAGPDPRRSRSNSGLHDTLTIPSAATDLHAFNVTSYRSVKTAARRLLLAVECSTCVDHDLMNGTGALARCTITCRHSLKFSSAAVPQTTSVRAGRSSSGTETEPWRSESGRSDSEVSTRAPVRCRRKDASVAANIPVARTTIEDAADMPWRVRASRGPIP